MNPFESPTAVNEPEELLPDKGPPTNIRHAIVAATTLAAFLMYVDRACLAWIIGSDSFNNDVYLDETQRGQLKSAFFWVYALGQVPAGWLGERFPKRAVLTAMILLWSACTALMSFSEGLTLLLVARIGCGIAQAGAYPIASSLLTRWSHLNRRAMASSVVSFGGRLGLVLAPSITALIIGVYGWRWAGWLYGIAGIFTAALFYVVFRETPEGHPQCNEAEREYLRPVAVSKPAATASAFPFVAILTDTSLWLMCAVQFLTNVGWAFAINSMADYFKRVYAVSDELNGVISTFALVGGIGGLLIGGVLTDAATRRLGIRWGRRGPIVVTRFLAAGTLALCLVTGNLWISAVLLGLMIFWNDAGVPAMWAYAQDVGGKHVAPIMGWANMWGNFGAALQPTLLVWVATHLDANRDGKEAFLVSSGAFALAGFLALGINAEKPVVK